MLIPMAPSVSIIIPNRNHGATLGRSIEAALASRHESFEVIVVDDASSDPSIRVIERYPCRLVRLPDHEGAAAARNAGARASRGEILFFTDADCILRVDSVALACETLAREGRGSVVGGTYTALPRDRGFFSTFQSIFVHCAETRRPRSPDYLATHALAIRAEDFRASTGFRVPFLPIMEDVEFSHRLRRLGYRLVMNPALQVEHVFGLSFFGSLANALRKAHYWTLYSARNGDLLADSGTASAALKFNGVACVASLLLLLALIAGGNPALLGAFGAVVALNIHANRALLRAFFRTGGAPFGVLAAAYYLGLFPLAAGAGTFAGLIRSLAWPPAGWGRR